MNFKKMTKTEREKRLNKLRGARKGSSSIFIVAPFDYGSTVPFGGARIVKTYWNSTHPFTSEPERSFRPLKSTDSTSYVYSNQSQQVKDISNRAGIDGAAAGWSFSASVSVRRSFSASRSKVVAGLNVIQDMGSWSFDTDELEVREAVADLLDPAGKTPEKHKEDLGKFVKQYGTYYVSSYQVRASLACNWEIEVSKVSDNSEVATEISLTFAKGSKKFGLVNQNVIKQSTTREETTNRSKINSFGLETEPSTPEHCDEIVADWDKHVNPDHGSVHAVTIKTWDTIPVISDFLFLIPTTEEWKGVTDILYEGTVSQEVLNQAYVLYNRFETTQKLLKASSSEPYSNGFWGFFVSREKLPLKEITSLGLDAGIGAQMISDIKELDFEKTFLANKKNLESGFEKIDKAFKTLTELKPFDIWLGAYVWNDWEITDDPVASFDYRVIDPGMYGGQVRKLTYDFSKYDGFKLESNKPILYNAGIDVPFRRRDLSTNSLSLYYKLYPIIDHDGSEPRPRFYFDMAEYGEILHKKKWSGSAYMNGEHTYASGQKRGEKVTGHFRLQGDWWTWVEVMWLNTWHPPDYTYTPTWK